MPGMCENRQAKRLGKIRAPSSNHKQKAGSELGMVRDFETSKPAFSGTKPPARPSLPNSLETMPSTGDQVFNPARLWETSLPNYHKQ